MRDEATDLLPDSRRMLNAPLLVVAAAAVAVATHDTLGRSERTTARPALASLASPVSTAAARQSSRTALAVARAPGATEPDTTKINPCLSYDASARTVAVTIVGAATSAQGGFNFNGGSSGNQTITMPAAWTVNMACGVPGHATSGMYIRFVVSSSATAPANTGTIALP
jgi:hypothetical protein